MAKNKYGVSRYIRPEIKRTVRRRCGFGCVICGNAIVTYEHFDPAFENVTSTHDANGITLLCGSHQLESTKGLLSKESISEYDRQPFCKKQGYSKTAFDLGSFRPNLIIGGNDMSECGPGIKINGEFFLRVDPPEKKSNRWQVSCCFQDTRGSKICEIVKNELRLAADNVDIEQTANHFCIRSEEEVLLDLEISPPHTFILKQYCLYTKNGCLFIGESDVPDIEFEFQNPGQPRRMVREQVLQFGGSTFISSRFSSSTGINFEITDKGLSIGG